MAETWRNCTACKNPIPYNATHWVCSVSTCNRKATGYVFCTVSCWDSHVADANHRDAWAVEARAPSKEAWARETAENPPATTPAPRQMPAGSPAAAPVVRRVVGDASPSTAAAVEGMKLADVADKDILIVVSKLKKYIKDRAGFNTSDNVMDLLSDHVRAICDEAIRSAARDERKTVLDRDIPRPRR